MFKCLKVYGTFLIEDFNCALNLSIARSTGVVPVHNHCRTLILNYVK